MSRSLSKAGVLPSSPRTERTWETAKSQALVLQLQRSSSTLDIAQVYHETQAAVILKCPPVTLMCNRDCKLCLSLWYPGSVLRPRSPGLEDIGTTLNVEAE